MASASIEARSAHTLSTDRNSPPVPRKNAARHPGNAANIGREYLAANSSYSAARPASMRVCHRRAIMATSRMGASGVRVELDTASDQPSKRERDVGASRNTSLRRQIRRSISGRASVVQARERARAATWASYAATLPKPENHAKTVSPSLTGSRGNVFGLRSVTKEASHFADAATSRGARARAKKSANASSV